MATVPVALVLAATAPYLISLRNRYFLMIYRILIASTIASIVLSTIEAAIRGRRDLAGAGVWSEFAGERFGQDHILRPDRVVAMSPPLASLEGPFLVRRAADVS
jgi:hypothetical protein